MCDPISVLLLTCSKVRVPVFGNPDLPLKVSLLELGWRFTWKLPATLGDQSVQLSQSPAALNTIFQADAYQSQLQSSHLPHLWNASIMQAFRQFLLQFPTGVLTSGLFPAGVLVLGQIILPVCEVYVRVGGRMRSKT